MEKSALCVEKAAYEYIAKSIELANAGKVDAVATTRSTKNPFMRQKFRISDIQRSLEH